MPLKKKKVLILTMLAIIAAAAIYPYQSVVVPAWKVKVTDVEGKACQNMPVMESWGHYSLFLFGNTDSEDSYTDGEGFVLFPERHIRASGIRRLVMPFVTKALTIAHGGYGVHASVHVNGLVDVAWLSYKGEGPLPETARVKKCLTIEDLRPRETR